jgi:hypothetical protein
MELTNLLYVGVIVALLFTCFGFFYASMATSYPTSSMNSIQVSNYTNLTNQMSQTAESAKAQAMNTPGANDPLGALLGYFKGAFSALTVFLQLPELSAQSFNLIFAQLGIFNTSFMIQLSAFIGIGLVIVFVVGAMYYLTKVR